MRLRLSRLLIGLSLLVLLGCLASAQAPQAREALARCAGGERSPCDGTPSNGLTVAPSTNSIQVGATVQLTISGGGTAKWTTSSAAIATVNGSGLVTGVGVGVATITAVRGNRTGTASVTVTTAVPVDCVVSDWSDWLRVGGSESSWSACVDGSQSRTYQEQRTRSVITPASGGGAACPSPLSESRTLSESQSCESGGGGDTITATSCSSSAVQSALDSSSTGDTVIIPNGSCTWTSGVTTSGKGIVLRGQSSGGVTITNNVTTAPAVSITESTLSHVDVSQLSVIGNDSEYAAIEVFAAVGGQAVLLHDNTFTTSRAIRIHGHRGVVYANTVNQTANRNLGFVQCTAGSSPTSWTEPSTMGAADLTGQSNLYVEDNTISYGTAQTIDAAGDCRIVVRYNTFNYSVISSHGPDTEPYGLRHMEIYNNTFVWVNHGDCDGSQTVNLVYWIFWRGGTGVITDNTGLTDMSSCAWGNKPALTMTVMNLQRNAGPDPCWGQGTSGGARYYAPRQVGLGYVTGTGLDGLGRSTDDFTYVGDPEPLYIWNETFTPSLADYGGSECTSPDTTTNYITSPRNYVMGTPKPGYVKYSYPHPLRAGS